MAKSTKMSMFLKRARKEDIEKIINTINDIKKKYPKEEYKGREAERRKNINEDFKEIYEFNFYPQIEYLCMGLGIYETERIPLLHEKCIEITQSSYIDKDNSDFYKSISKIRYQYDSESEPETTKKSINFENNVWQKISCFIKNPVYKRLGEHFVINRIAELGIDIIEKSN